MSNLLISEPPLQVLPSLAVKVGLKEAIILQQFHYWLQRSNNFRDGRRWIYNSVAEWQKQFPFWKSKTTIVNALDNLEKKGLLITANYNKAKFDKTKWYSINYDALDKLDNQEKEQVVNDLPKNGKRDTNNWQMEEPETGKPIPIDYQESTTETTTTTSSKLDHASEREEIINYLNSKTNKHYKPNASKTKSLINARLKDGFTVDEFKKVIDNKTAEWLNNPKMNKFLRPDTLFTGKFDGYLNETSTNDINRGYEDGATW